MESRKGNVDVGAGDVAPDTWAKNSWWLRATVLTFKVTVANGLGLDLQAYSRHVYNVYDSMDGIYYAPQTRRRLFWCVSCNRF